MAKRKVAKKKTPQTVPKIKQAAAAPEPVRTPEELESELNLKRELFCQCITRRGELFGNGTLSYAEAYGYKLEELSRDDAKYEYQGKGKHRKKVKVEASSYDRAYNVCAVEAARLLRNPKILARITELLNELLSNDIVDAEMAKLIVQDDDKPTKRAAISDYNKLRGRIIDKVKDVSESFTLDDIRTLLAPLPQERQDEVYGYITSAIAEAEQLLRSQKKI